jgi:hypothetical protein
MRTPTSSRVRGPEWVAAVPCLPSRAGVDALRGPEGVAQPRGGLAALPPCAAARGVRTDPAGRGQGAACHRRGGGPPPPPPTLKTPDGSRFSELERLRRPRMRTTGTAFACCARRGGRQPGQREQRPVAQVNRYVAPEQNERRRCVTVASSVAADRQQGFAAAVAAARSRPACCSCSTLAAPVSCECCATAPDPEQPALHHSPPGAAAGAQHTLYGEDGKGARDCNVQSVAATANFVRGRRRPARTGPTGTNLAPHEGTRGGTARHDVRCRGMGSAP